MKVTKTASLILALLLVFPVLTIHGFSAGEQPDISKFALPKPAAPLYHIFDAADRTATEGSDALSVIAVYDGTVAALGAEWEANGEAFLEKYGLYSFELFMQFDTSLDGTKHWNHTSEWDNDYSAPSSDEATATQAVRANMFEEVSIFDLYKKITYPESYSKILDAIIQRDVPDGDYTFNNFYFDHEHHSLYIRARYYMEWETYDGTTIGERQSKVGEWSDAAIFGKNGNSIMPDAPTGYEAPVISDLKYVPPGEGYEFGYLTYFQSTPESVWRAGIYYQMIGDGSFEGLDTQISIDGGEWQPYTTSNAWGDWCLWTGARTAFYEEARIEANSHIQLRVRFLGPHGPSKWSNVLELNGGGTQDVTEDTGGTPDRKPTVEKDKCSLCGFCSVPLGLCLFIWLLILLAGIVIVVIILLATKPKKCKNCGEKWKKGEKHCPKCGNERK